MGVGAAPALTIQATGDVPLENNLRAVPIACESLGSTRDVEMFNVRAVDIVGF